MKKIISLALACLTLISTLAFAGCGETFKCDMCGETKTGKKISMEVDGKVVANMCSDCDKELSKALGELG